MENAQTEPTKRIAAVQLISGPEFRDWLAEFARHQRLKTPTLTEHALVAYAAAKGFTPPPER